MNQATKRAQYTDYLHKNIQNYTKKLPVIAKIEQCCEPPVTIVKLHLFEH
jgi:hypothetical protein